MKGITEIPVLSYKVLPEVAEDIVIIIVNLDKGSCQSRKKKKSVTFVTLLVLNPPPPRV